MNRLLHILLLLTVGFTAFGQSYSYEVSWSQPQTHYFELTLTTSPSSDATTTFQMPEWRPGRYELMNYAAGVAAFDAVDSNGKSLKWKKVSVNDWQVENPTKGDITVTYQFYANVMDAGSSVLNEEQAYINGINLFMHVKDRYEASCELRFLSVPDDWKIGTALKPKANARHAFVASSYHELVDSPLILSPTLRTLEFEDHGVNFYIHYQGPFGAGEEGENLMVQNTRKIVAEQRALFGDYPFESYHFLFEFVPEMTGHAVEHANSSCYVLGQAFVRNTAYFNLLFNVISHEFFHLWNVKRVRPAALWPYDYQTRPYTGLHWFTEGVTSYYADLMLVRTGILTPKEYLGTIGKILTQMDNSYAEKEVSPYQASMDSWVSESAYKNSDLGISYYSLGHRLGAYLDLTLRAKTSGEKGLDDAFIYLFENYYSKDLGVPENGIQLACEAVSGTSFQSFFDSYVTGTEKMDYTALLKPVGLKVNKALNAGAGPRNLGIIEHEYAGDTIIIKRILANSDATRAGLKEGMRLVGINGKLLADQSLSAFMEETSYPAKVTIQVAGETDKVLQWTGNQNQYRFTVEESPDATPQQTAAKEKWISSRQIE